MSDFFPILKIKNSDITGRAPADLESGELAINNYDGKLFYRNSKEGGVNSLNLLSGLSLQSFLNFEKELRDYRNADVGTIVNWTISSVSDAVPPYKHDYNYYGVCHYNPQTESINKRQNIKSVTKQGVGSYIFEFISPFPNTEYEVTIDYPQFEEGGVVYFSKIANKTASSLSIITATASSDSNSNVVTTNHDLTYLNLKCVA